MDREIRVLIISGAGGAFCAGGDVRAMNASASEMSAEMRRTSMQRHHRNVKMLAALDRPVIAAVDGPAFGAGFSLALLADMVIATPRARFCMAFARIGLIPDFGALMPRARALAAALAHASPLALSLTKSALGNSLGSDLATMLDIEAAGQGIAGASDYAKESFRRFAAREPARFVWPAPTPK